MDKNIEDLLRASLRDHADDAPAGDLLAERIVSQAERGGRRPRQWRTWALPLVAAGGVAALVSAIVLASDQFRHSSAPPAGSGHSSAASTQSGSPSPSAVHPVQPFPSAPSSASSSQSTSRGSTSVAGPPNGWMPPGFRAHDLTWISNSDGWALGTAPCSKAPCTSIARTRDGGKTWVGIPAPVANLASAQGCSDPCVSSIRFADALHGYVYGDAASFYVTSNGGATWTRQQPSGTDAQYGGNVALEVANGTVVRVLSGAGVVRVEQAPVGSGAWQNVPLSSPGNFSMRAGIARTGSLVLVAAFGHTTGGAQNAQTHLFVSRNDGASFTDRGEPCPQRGGEVDSVQMTAGADGTIMLLCLPRQAPVHGEFVVVSTDGGNSFHAAPASLGASNISVIGAASSGALFLDSDALYRSTDGGATWQPVLGVTGASWIGFETPTVGRLVSGDGSTVWTTTDAGLHWSKHTFH